jgi:signal transduction histidine kinase
VWGAAPLETLTVSVRGPFAVRLGLRARVTAAFALGALLVSLALCGVTYGFSRSYLIRQRENLAVRQTYVNAQLVRTGLRSALPDVPQLLQGLGTSAAGSDSLLRYTGQWFATSLGVGRDALPAALRAEVSGGSPARQRYRLDGRATLAVGVPIRAAEAQYYEVFNLDDLDDTLRTLGTILAVAAAGAVLAGAALGRWASGRVLRPVSEAAKAAADIAGGHFATRLTTGDDSDLAALSSSFNRMVDALKERIDRDARFASDVSHELRSPLTTLATSLQVLQARRSQLPDRARRALDLLAAEVERFERLVQDLLEISRFDAGVAQLSLEDVRLGELLVHAVPTGTGVELDIEPEATGQVVRGDKRRLERVVGNLVANAASHGGGARRVGLRRHDGKLRVEVDDEGPGVPEDERRRIFERFNRGGAAGRRGGADGVGLGLSIVHEHVQLHGGRVWVEDRPGGGARFVVELPVQEDAQ